MRAIAVKPAGSWSAKAADSVVLDYDDRHRRRMAMTGRRGIAFLLDLAEAVRLRHGDGLLLEDGRIVAVEAAAEPLHEIRMDDPLELARIAWHLGNRHTPAQILPDAIRLRRDHVLAAMAVGLGAEVVDIVAPFEPEGGAYEHDHSDHGREHGKIRRRAARNGVHHGHRRHGR
jgi:urease accessory protein